jgi:hypothetical protein
MAIFDVRKWLAGELRCEVEEIVLVGEAVPGRRGTEARYRLMTAVGEAVVLVACHGRIPPSPAE